MTQSMKFVAIAALAMAGLAATADAKADPIDNVNLTFQSGATFSGTVTLAPDYSYIEAATGTLTGYQYGTNAFVGSGSDAIDWAWNDRSACIRAASRKLGLTGPPRSPRKAVLGQRFRHELDKVGDRFSR